MRSRGRVRPRLLAAPLLLAALLLIVPSSTARAAGPPPAPLSLDRDLLSNLSAPSVAPGSSCTVRFTLVDPSSFGALANVTVELDLYALNGYPGDDVGALPAVGAPTLATGSHSGPSVNFSFASVPPGSSRAGSATFATAASTPTGTYAIRTRVTFTEAGLGYLFASRGWFSASAWANATTGSGGAATVNATRLGVSGILPETAVYVAPSDWPWAIGALAAGGFVLVGLGAWLYFRKGPGSSAGAAKPEAPGATNAPSAFGSRRNSPGDSRSS